MMKIPMLARFNLGAQSSLIKNVSWLVIARIGTQALMVLFTLVLARRLGSAAFGAYAFFAAVIFAGNALTTFGTDMLLIREIASRDDLSLLAPALLIQLALSGGLIAITCAVAPVIPNQTPDSMMALRLYTLALLPLAFFSVFTTALRGKQRMAGYMALNLLVSTLQVVVVWIFVRRGSSVTSLAGLLVLVQCVGAAAGGLLCAAQIPRFWRGWRFSWRQTAHLVRLSAPIAIIALVGILYQKVSVTMVAMLVGQAQTGWFSAALRVVEASKTVHLAVFTALYPLMAQAVSENARITMQEPPRAFWYGAIRQSWLLLLAGAVAASLGMYFMAGNLTRWLYGTEYLPAAQNLRLIGFILIPFTVNTFYSLANLANHREKTVLAVLLTGLAGLIGLNAWLIPRSGGAGASAAFVLAETAQSLLYLGPAKNLAWRLLPGQSLSRNQPNSEQETQPGD